MKCITHAGKVAAFALERKSLNTPNAFTNELGASPEILKNIKKVLQTIKECEDKIKLHKDLNQKLSIKHDDSANLERASFNELSQLTLLLKTLLRTLPS